MSNKEEIKRQIAALQAELAKVPDSPPSKRGRKDEATVLAPTTPSPRKKSVARVCAESPTNIVKRKQEPRPVPSLNLAQKRDPSSVVKPNNSKLQQEETPSAFVSQLKSLSANKADEREVIARTDGFEEKPASLAVPDTVRGAPRDDRLAIVEDLELGPTEHKPVADDPNYERIEPNSGTRLKERVLPHSSLQDHLTGRYFLPPSLLYSVVRLQPNKQAYEVPVEGDWVTIAVVAERGDVKITSGPGNAAHNKGPEDKGVDREKKGSNGRKRKREEEDEDDDNPRQGGKKYVHLRLIDLGHRSRSFHSSSSSTPGSLRGDAQLSLLLFESDYYDKLIDKSRKKDSIQKLWRGGSGGAFEECFPRLREGTVIALLNPKVLKPFVNSKNPSSATSSILALTPPSASAIAIIGYAADLGRCVVQRRDGKPCGSWVDRRAKRVGTSSAKRGDDVCEYHLQTAVQRARAGRAEFSVGTSGMSSTAHKRKPAYDPARQWGLKPETGSRGLDGEATYVVGGLVASSSRSQALGGVSGTMGREEQARARRKAGAQEDKALAELLGKGASGTPGHGGGGVSTEALLVVRRARETVIKPKENGDRTSKSEGEGTANSTASGEVACEQPRRKVYSAEIVKSLGFDPTMKAYGMSKSREKSRASDAINKLKVQGREIRLGPPPGMKVRSGVSVPSPSTNKNTSSTDPTGKDQEDGLSTSYISEVEESLRSNLLARGLGEKIASSTASRLCTQPANDSDSDLEIEPSP